MLIIIANKSKYNVRIYKNCETIVTQNQYEITIKVKLIFKVYLKNLGNYQGNIYYIANSLYFCTYLLFIPFTIKYAF